MGTTTTTTRLRCLLLFLVQLLLLLSAAAGARWQDFLRLPSESEGDAAAGTRWAVLIAGSNGYYNYRHQASYLLNNSCHTCRCIPASISIVCSHCRITSSRGTEEIYFF